MTHTSEICDIKYLTLKKEVNKNKIKTIQTHLNDLKSYIKS